MNQKTKKMKHQAEHLEDREVTLIRRLQNELKKPNLSALRRARIVRALAEAGRLTKEDKEEFLNGRDGKKGL